MTTFFAKRSLKTRLAFGLAVFVVASLALAGQAQAAPTVQTLSATGISGASVTLNGVLNPQGLNTTYWFEYGTTYSLGQVTSQQNAGSPNAQISVYNTVYGLAPNATYYFRLIAQNASGVAQGQILSFQTNGNGNGGYGAPIVNTGSAQPTGNSVLLNGDVNPQGGNAQVWFRYGQNSGSLSNTTNIDSVYGNYQQSVSQYASNLVPGATYYYQAVAQNQYGTTYGQILTFNASGNGGGAGPGFSQAPSVVTNSASGVTRTSATVNSQVNPNGSLSSIWFEYGRSTALGSVTTRDPAGSDFSSRNYATTIAGLTPGITYYYRVVAQNQGGTVRGQIASFRTEGPAFVPGSGNGGSGNTGGTTGGNTGGNGSGTGNTGGTGITGGTGNTGGNQPPISTVTTTPIGAPGCFSVTPSLSAPQVKANDDVTYSVTYRNNCGYTLSNASLQITLPAAVDFASTNYPFLSRDGSSISYNLGTIAPNFQAAVTVSGKVKAQVNNGDNLIFQASLNFTDPRGVLQTATGYLSATVVDSNATGSDGNASSSSSLGASTADALGGLFHSGWFWLVLFLILIALFVFWLATRRRGEEEEDTLPTEAHGAAH